MRLNEKNVSGITVPPGKSEVIVFDDKLTGFGFRVRAAGSRTWLVQYRTETGQQKKHGLGRYPLTTVAAARAAAEKKLLEIKNGGDPQGARDEEAERARTTLAVVAERYLGWVRPAAAADASTSHRKLRPRSYDEVRRHLEDHWAPLRRLPVHRITKLAVANRLNEITDEKGPIAANRARSTLSSVFRFAMGAGLAESNPVIGTNKAVKEVARERALTPDELAAVWREVGEGEFGTIIKLLTLTAQRRQEVGEMAWNEIDVDRALWTIPGARSKNGLEHLVPLSDEVLAILTALPRRAGRDLVFGYGKGGFSGWSKCKERVDGRLAATGAELKPWRLHDLRRTASTLMGDELGVQPHVIETILNHSGGFRSGVGGVYNKSAYMAERRQALAAWGHYVDALVHGRGSKVVPLRGARV